MDEIIKSFCENNNIECGERQLKQLDIFYNFLIETNQKFNLTAITDKKEVYIKHFIDSLSAAEFFKQNAFVIDVGAGAGFPSVVLKIFRADLNIVMLDSLLKRVNFLNELCEKLRFKDYKCIHSRAEDVARDIQYREKFDTVTARAVAKLNTLLEYTLPFLKLGGKFVAYKSNFADELVQSKKALQVLNGELDLVKEFNLPETNDKRGILVFEKVGACPKEYPRFGDKPKSNPL